MASKTKKDAIPVCDICNKPKVELKERTEQTGAQIFVCADLVPGKKMPCDGWITKTAVLA